MQLLGEKSGSDALKDLESCVDPAIAFEEWRDYFYAELAEKYDALRNGATLPPETVFDDEDQVWLADCFHRLGAHRAAGILTLECEVRFGGQSDAAEVEASLK